MTSTTFQPNFSLFPIIFYFFLILFTTQSTIASVPSNSTNIYLGYPFSSNDFGPLYHTSLSLSNFQTAAQNGDLTGCMSAFTSPDLTLGTPSLKAIALETDASQDYSTTLNVYFSKALGLASSTQSSNPITQLINDALQSNGIFSSSALPLGYKLFSAFGMARYFVIWAKLVDEFSDTIELCKGNSEVLLDYKESWDLAFGLYSGDPTSPGDPLQYPTTWALSAMHCKIFNTCLTSDAIPVSKSNSAVLGQAVAGQTLLSSMDCLSTFSDENVMTPVLIVPLIQSALYCALMADPNRPCPTCATPDRAQEAAELWSATAALLPLFDVCDTGVSAYLLKVTRPETLASGVLLPDGFSGYLSVIQSTYDCLGIQCSDVGGDASLGIPPCADSSALNVAGVALSGTYLENELKLADDVTAIANFANFSDWTAALAVYTGGMNSMAEDGSNTLRSLQSLLANSFSGVHVSQIDLGTRYWGRSDFADAFIQSILAGTGGFASSSSTGRALALPAALQQITLRLYVDGLMTIAINECQIANAQAQLSVALNTWNRASAAYFGSGLSDSGSGQGNSVTNLAETLCSHFSTCGKFGNSAAPTVVAASTALAAGQAALSLGACSGASQAAANLGPATSVGLVQGILFNAYLADPNSPCLHGTPSPCDTATKEQARASLWTYTAALLPFLSQCNSSTFIMLRSNADPMANPAVPDGFASVVSTIQSLYPCLGIRCSDVGSSKAMKLPLCNDVSPRPPIACPSGSPSPDNTAVPASVFGGAIIGISVGLILFSIVCGLACYRIGKNHAQVGREDGFGMDMRVVRGGLEVPNRQATNRNEIGVKNSAGATNNNENGRKVEEDQVIEI